MPKGLTDEQNALLRRVAQRLVEENGWTQRELGEHVGREQGVMSKFLDGRTGTTLEVARKLAELAKLQPLALIEGREEPVTPSVRTRPGYNEARASLSGDFTAKVLDAATRALDAVGADEIDSETLEDAALFAQRHRATVKPVGDTAKLIAAHNSERIPKHRKKAK